MGRLHVSSKLVAEVASIELDEETLVNPTRKRLKCKDIDNTKDRKETKYIRPCLEESVNENFGEKKLKFVPLKTGFDPLQISQLDLCTLKESRKHIFQTGCLPKWICRFINLQVLRAPKLGLVILEPWILDLKHLQVLQLEHNQITTWPHFLRELSEIKEICLDGNPCLEKAFQKSPTLRSWYFCWQAKNEVYRAPPDHIRGSEWPPLSSARLTNSSSLNHLGFYCGGIYTLSTVRDTSNDGLLTPLEPNPLMTRAGFRTTKSEKSSPVKTLYSSESSKSSNLWTDSFISVSTGGSAGTGNTLRKHSVKQTRILREIFDDIHALVNRENFKPPSSDRPHVLLAGKSSDAVNKLLAFEHSGPPDSNVKELYKFACILVREEENYINELLIVRRQFYDAKIRSSNISDSLRVVFTCFPAMLSIHRKQILPSLNVLTQNLLKLLELKSAVENQSLRPEQIEGVQVSFGSTILQTVALLCTAFRRLQLAIESYSSNLWQAEFLLDAPFASTSLYENEEFGEFVKLQMAKLDGLGGHLGVSLGGYAPSFFSKEYSTTGVFGLYKSFFKPQGKPVTPASLSSTSEPPLNQGAKNSRFEKDSSIKEWTRAQLQKPRPKITRDPMDFVYLPLIRLVRYERFFTSFSRINNRFDPLVKVFRYMRRVAAAEIQAARRNARCRLLSIKLRTTPQYFDNYRWDVVLAVRSRGYLESGILSKSTNDVIDLDNTAVSFVKESFSSSRLRILRLIHCGTEIMIWDEIFEHFIGRVSKSRLIAMPSRDPSRSSEVRIVIIDALETCVVEVKDFKAKYLTTHDYRREFLEACRCDCKIVL